MASLEHLWLTPKGGLCNRIRVLASARRICEQRQLRCTVVWDWGAYYDLFAPCDTDSFETADVPDPSAQIIEHMRPADGGAPDNWRLPLTGARSIWLKTQYPFCEEEETPVPPRQLRPWLPRPADRVLGLVQAFRQRHFRDTVGLHIRRTDHQPATLATPDAVCLAEAGRVIAESRTVFLATDNAETERMIKDRFGPELIIRAKNPDLAQRWPRPSFSLKETIDDLVDLHLLACSDYVLGCRHSSFSQVATLYNGSRRCRLMSAEPPRGKSRFAGGEGDIDQREMWRRRTEDVLACPETAAIPRHPDAGRIQGDVQIMHNGIKVAYGSYHGPAAAELLEQTRGVHEPQQEKRFGQALSRLPEGAVMLELGCSWAFYSLWFAQSVRGAACYLVEPHLRNLHAGQLNFFLNGRAGTFLRAAVGAVPGRLPGGARVVALDSLLAEWELPRVHLLHADIQGAETDMLLGAARALAERRIDLLFLSTHSGPLHEECRARLRGHGYILLADIPPEQSFPVDGLIVSHHDPSWRLEE